MAPEPFPSPAPLTRRGFLALGAGVTAAAALAACSTDTTNTPSLVQPNSDAVRATENARHAAGAPVREVALRAAPSTVDLGGVQVPTWTYDGKLPGKEIRITRGEVLRAGLTNALPAPTTIHWHGIALRNDMDGMPDLTQPAVAPGGSFFVMADIRSTGLDSWDFSTRLLQEYGVGVVPGAAFGAEGEGFVRITLAASMEALTEGLTRMATAVDVLRSGKSGASGQEVSA